MTSVPLRTIAGLHESVLDYANRVHDLRSPSDVLNELHDITKKVSLPVLGAARFPPKAAGWDSVQLGNSVFLHKGVPKGWWEEYQTLARGKWIFTDRHIARRLTRGHRQQPLRSG